MKILITLTLLLFSLVPLLSNSESAEKAEVLCHCLKSAINSKKVSEQKACLDLREKHVKELGKNTPAYKSYLSLIGDCEKNLTKSSNQGDELSSYEAKVKVVCDCFQGGKSNKPKCFQLQSELGKSFASDPEKKKAFNLETGACDK